MATDLERITRLEERVRDQARNIEDGRKEDLRTRDRLHKIEGTLGTLAEYVTAAQKKAQENQEKMRIRIQVLTLVIGATGIVTPVVVGVLATH